MDDGLWNDLKLRPYIFVFMPIFVGFLMRETNCGDGYGTYLMFWESTNNRRLGVSAEKHSLLILF